jgi:DNA-binding NarL/FixJ family response regulator
MLAIPGEMPVITEVPPAADPFSAPLRPVSSLLQFAPEGSSGHRAHVHGVVIKRLKPEELSQRELDVLQSLVKGRSNKEIAAALFISEATVKSHLQNLFAKLGVQDRVGAAVAAIRQGIVHLE